MRENSLFWFRRDLRLHDNHGLYQALKSSDQVIPLFIFDTDILERLDSPLDPRVEFIHRKVLELDEMLAENGRRLLVRVGRPEEVIPEIARTYNVTSVFVNEDYEPAAIKRDQRISEWASSKGIAFNAFKDHVIFHPNEITKPDGLPYTIYTPYSRSWLSAYESTQVNTYPSEALLNGINKGEWPSIPSLEEIGFKPTGVAFSSTQVSTSLLTSYDETRNFPALQGTSGLGVHLRFGTVSVREVVALGATYNQTFLKELIWRDFFISILFHFPYSVDQPFRQKYRNIEWRNDEEEFWRWCQGQTGFPIVDAGMRELNQTGYMHNRVRMIVASFLSKHLLIDWKWGERYFASKLLDFELASNVGNWQWAAGCGCDAAPYFRIFNPWTQAEKFDPNEKYIRRWVPELHSSSYPAPMVDHKFARERCLSVYKNAIAI